MKTRNYTILLILLPLALAKPVPAQMIAAKDGDTKKMETMEDSLKKIQENINSVEKHIDELAKYKNPEGKNEVSMELDAKVKNDFARRQKTFVKIMVNMKFSGKNLASMEIKESESNLITNQYTRHRSIIKDAFTSGNYDNLKMIEIEEFGFTNDKPKNEVLYGKLADGNSKKLLLYRYLEYLKRIEFFLQVYENAVKRQADQRLQDMLAN